MQAARASATDAGSIRRGLWRDLSLSEPTSVGVCNAKCARAKERKAILDPLRYDPMILYLKRSKTCFNEDLQLFDAHLKALFVHPIKRHFNAPKY